MAAEGVHQAEEIASTAMKAAEQAVREEMEAAAVRKETKKALEQAMANLQDLGISFAEFMTAIEEFNSPYTFYIEEIDSAYKKGDIDALNAIAQTQENLYDETNQILFKYNAIMTRLLLNDLTEVEIPEADKHLISEYLLKCSVWTSYEVILLGNSLRGLTKSLQDVFVADMIAKLPTIQEDNPLKVHILSILINVCFDRLRSEETDEVNDIMAAIQPQLSTNAYYFKNRLLFLKGIVAIVEGQFDEGVSKCQKAIQVFELFDEPFAKMHQDELDTYVKNYA